MSLVQVTRTCIVCQNTFLARPHDVARGGALFCTRACYLKQQTPLVDRFWKKVNKEGPTPEHCPELGPCWIWTAAHKNGKWKYGVITKTGKGDSLVLAHRVSWELHYGPIPEGLLALHKCDNPPCVNPSHLFLGTFFDNTNDMREKGRHIGSGRKRGCKLSPESLASFRAKRKTLNS